MDATAALNSMESTISDQEQEGNARNHPHPGKGKRMSKVGGRGKPGENRRPRPSGRQLIQEGVQELRELVPNGTEVEQSTIGCSNNKGHDRCIAEQAVSIIG
ncbi:PREDICTED: transcription factor bHLH157-like [Populus euphratica]|uniref:Transcription factor bHLH157-like n=1 Tax=Populus euphratica TaxID=75702 RepID=A0AAJ6THA1_POPEU|nr:PREDICTED: transcription factor bHLH157-like [Populus euphratica]